MINDLSPDEFDAVVDNDVDFFLEQEFTDKKRQFFEFYPLVRKAQSFRSV